MARKKLNDGSRHEERTHGALRRRMPNATIVSGATLPSGRRPDHLVVNGRGRVVGVVESKDVEVLSHAHIDQVLDYSDELGRPRLRAVSVAARTYVSPAVEDRMDEEGIALLIVRKRAPARPKLPSIDAPRAAFGGTLVGLGTYELARKNGMPEKDARGLGFFAGVITTLLSL